MGKSSAKWIASYMDCFKTSMRKVLFQIVISLLSGSLLSQSANDSVWLKIEAETNSAKKPVNGSTNSRKSIVVITSGSQADAKRDNSTWENRWQNHIDKESVKIAEKVISKDATKIVYKLQVDFSINEDGSLKDLKIVCSPYNQLVESESRKMVLAAPKKSPVYKNAKYVRTNITQPIEIRIK